MTDWLLSILWYGSFVLLIVGIAAWVKPIRRLRLARRARGVTLAAASIAAIVLNASVAPPRSQVETPATALDRIMPLYHFREAHERRVGASAARVRAAITTVTASEITLFRLFTGIRRFGRSGPESILNAPEAQPILDVATRTGFVLLADTEHEIVVGTIVVAPDLARARASRASADAFEQFADAGVVKATMNFLVVPESESATRLTTETRVFGTTADGIRRFTPYWRTIFPGSWILRVTWLDAIAARATR